MIADLDISAAVLAALPILFQESSHVLGNFIQGFKFLIILHKHVWVNFMNEYFKSYTWINLVGNFYYIKKFVAWDILILLMSIDNVDQRPALFNKFYILRLGVH